MTGETITCVSLRTYVDSSDVLHVVGELDGATVFAAELRAPASATAP